MKNFNEWQDTKSLKTITITCKDLDNSLEELLNCIKKTGNTGHSFSIIVDPEGDNDRFDWDGDGSDHIYNIKVSQENE